MVTSPKPSISINCAKSCRVASLTGRVNATILIGLASGRATLAANAPIAKTLRPYRDESVDFDTTKNLFIEGDNLDALKLLQENYLTKVRVIYIDPPYNTGSDLIYDDNFVGSSESFFIRSNQVDDAGNRLVVNRETDGKFHSDWLTMLYPRLRLARNLLSEDGIILISIDDGEVETLRLICNEIFGEANFVAQLIWEKGRKNDAKLFSIGHDYIVIYARSKTSLKDKGTQWREAKPGAFEIQEEYVRLKKLWADDVVGIEAGLQTFYQSLPKGHPSKKLTRYSHVDKRGVWRDDNMSWPGSGGAPLRRYTSGHRGCLQGTRRWLEILNTEKA